MYTNMWLHSAPFMNTQIYVYKEIPRFGRFCLGLKDPKQSSGGISSLLKASWGLEAWGAQLSRTVWWIYKAYHIIPIVHIYIYK